MTYRAPPPADSRPEAANFPAAHYEMSKDRTPFRAPANYPAPPTGMWYEVPKTPTYQKPAPIFPWEKTAGKPTRVFPDDIAEEQRRASLTLTTATASAPEPAASTTPTIAITSADPWQQYNTSRGNAWDDVPEIERYIGALQKNRKGNIQVLQGYGSGIEQVSSPGATRSIKLTDFPTELERPSLPVTPAPIRRPSFWGEERDADGELPAAEGVPAQADWVGCGHIAFFKMLSTAQDPAAQLEMLARRQSDVLSQKLGTENLKELPSRALPFGSEGVRSPTYVAPSASTAPHGDQTGSSGTAEQEKPSYNPNMAAFEKGESVPSQETPMPPSEEEKDVLQN